MGKRRRSAFSAESLEYIPHIRIWNSKLAIERIFRISKIQFCESIAHEASWAIDSEPIRARGIIVN